MLPITVKVEFALKVQGNLLYVILFPAGKEGFYFVITVKQRIVHDTSVPCWKRKVKKNLHFLGEIKKYP